MYSAFFLTLGVGAFVVSKGCEQLDIRTLGIAQTVTCVSVIGGFIATDLAVRRVDWSAGNTWLWIALFLAIGLFGVMLMRLTVESKKDRVA